MKKWCLEVIKMQHNVRWIGEERESGRPAGGLFASSRDEGRWAYTKVMAEQRTVASGGSWCYKGEESYQAV